MNLVELAESMTLSGPEIATERRRHRSKARSQANDCDGGGDCRGPDCAYSQDNDGDNTSDSQD